MNSAQEIRLGSIDDFIRLIDAARTHGEIFKLLRGHIEALGFERYSYELMTPPEGPHQPFYSNTYPQDWIRYYIQSGYAGDDVVSRYAAQRLRPFLWSDLTQRQKLTKMQLQVLNEGRDAGVGSGASFPLHGPGPAKAYLVVACDMPEAKFAKMFLPRQHEVHLIATYAHERLMAVGLPDIHLARFELTPREIEVLRWTARGKTTWEISIIAGISNDTVNFHLKNSFKKLGVNNKTYAVAVALAHGVIAL